MTDTVFKYPLDLTGTSAANLVKGEAHTIGTTRTRIFAPDYGPFFGNSASVTDTSTGTVLVLGQDFVPVHYYREASERTGQAVYAAIRIINPDIGVNVLYTGQQVGGEFSYSTYAIKLAIEELANDTRPVTWGELLGIPSQFVPTPHLHSVYDLYGMKYVVEAQADVAAAIREGDVGSHQLLLQQVSDKFTDFDDFAMQLAACFQSAASDLAAL